MQLLLRLYSYPHLKEVQNKVSGCANACYSNDSNSTLSWPYRKKKVNRIIASVAADNFSIITKGKNEKGKSGSGLIDFKGSGRNCPFFFDQSRGRVFFDDLQGGIRRKYGGKTNPSSDAGNWASEVPAWVR